MPKNVTERRCYCARNHIRSDQSFHQPHKEGHRFDKCGIWTTRPGTR